MINDWCLSYFSFSVVPFGSTVAWRLGYALYDSLPTLLLFLTCSFPPTSHLSPLTVLTYDPLLQTSSTLDNLHPKKEQTFERRWISNTVDGFALADGLATIQLSRWMIRHPILLLCDDSLTCTARLGPGLVDSRYPMLLFLSCSVQFPFIHLFLGAIDETHRSYNEERLDCFQSYNSNVWFSFYRGWETGVTMGLRSGGSIGMIYGSKQTKTSPRQHPQSPVLLDQHRRGQNTSKTRVRFNLVSLFPYGKRLCPCWMRPDGTTNKKRKGREQEASNFLWRSANSPDQNK